MFPLILSFMGGGGGGGDTIIPIKDCWYKGGTSQGLGLSSLPLLLLLPKRRFRDKLGLNWGLPLTPSPLTLNH